MTELHEFTPLPTPTVPLHAGPAGTGFESFLLVFLVILFDDLASPPAPRNTRSWHLQKVNTSGIAGKVTRFCYRRLVASRLDN